MLQQSLGLTRDTLRHYESLGLISPQKNKDNNYREYSFLDILHLLAIDHYKKHGLGLKDIHSILKGSSLQEMQRMLDHQEESLIEELRKTQLLLEELRHMKSFVAELNTVGELSIQKFPLCEILGEVTAFTSFEEYPAHFSRLAAEKSLLSRLIRVVTFNKEQYLDSKMVMVSQVSKKTEQKTYLESADCLYGIVRSKHYDEDSSLFYQLHPKCHQWAEARGIDFQGMVYIRPSLFLFGEENEQIFLEFWVPIKQ